MTYLDHNATSPLRPEVLDAMWPWLNKHHGNSQSVHQAGRFSRQAVEHARQQVAALVGCEAAEVIFTAGATEADNWALSGLRSGQPRLVGATEHDAVLQAVPDARRLAVEASGQITPEGLRMQIAAQGGALLSIMWANNETGVLNDIPALAAVAAEHGCGLHSDAVQAAGRVPVNFQASGLEAMSLSSHKMGGPLGAGALIVRRGVEIARGQRGGSHEGGLRAGTLNVPAIVGFGHACEMLQTEMSRESGRIQAWRDAFEQRLRQTFPEVEIYGADAPRIPNTSFFSLPGWHSEALLMALDKHDLALASGSACHSGTDTPSHVLAAMGVPTERALGAVRMSLGYSSQVSDLDQLLDALVAIDATRGHGSVFGELLGP